MGHLQQRDCGNAVSIFSLRAGSGVGFLFNTTSSRMSHVRVTASFERILYYFSYPELCIRFWVFCLLQHPSGSPIWDKNICWENIYFSFLNLVYIFLVDSIHENFIDFIGDDIKHVFRKSLNWNKAEVTIKSFSFRDFEVELILNI